MHTAVADTDAGCWQAVWWC